jgi:hypothetical protein
MATANDSMLAGQVEHVLAHLNSHQQLLAASDEAWSCLLAHFASIGKDDARGASVAEAFDEHAPMDMPLHQLSQHANQH